MVSKFFRFCRTAVISLRPEVISRGGAATGVPLRSDGRSGALPSYLKCLPPASGRCRECTHSGCQLCRRHRISTASGSPRMTGWRQRRRGLAGCWAPSASNCSSATQPCGVFVRTSPPLARTSATPPATSQMFGRAKRATRSSPAATKAHSIAAEPVLRSSHGSASPELAHGSPARWRRTASFASSVSGSPSKRSLPPTRA
jgi:hypothetical protein